MADTQEDLEKKSSGKKSSSSSGKKKKSSSSRVKTLKDSDGALLSKSTVAMYNLRSHLEPAQVEKIDQLKDNILNDPSLDLPEHIIVWLDDMCFKRYLAAREWKIPAAEAMIRETIKWRCEYRPDLIRCDEEPIRLQLRHGHMYNTFADLEGHPGMVMIVHEHKDVVEDEDQRLRFMIYALEKAIFQMRSHETGIDKMYWLVQCKGYSRKHNGTLGFAKRLNNIVCNHYPERLFRVGMFNAPWIFKTFYKVISPFIDPVTREKFGFPDPTAKAMEKDFDLDHLEVQFGGRCEVAFDADSYWEDVKSSDEERVAWWEAKIEQVRKEKAKKAKKAKKASKESTAE
mmetsp:Transcript_46681/g.117611  ORF Transcript_46681/g.117611 Transcript_46681/m.117611 type:complete len:343 (-) Transcript_46681:25-1053(-)|eukprot:CAMPEP_0177655184 /NCGR_PEP_ID=MMETSP0447-20121125/14805_1 /TAXON_ID=0 /ORGANISM="Stygamoeba regulata, Strain BSH-02190019" /LENGTH=342 /DNA_ID=CAMNT_0019159033 /DNA_START=19 /DNA_END=1047 /DNA_ORIENTATION=+